MKNRLLLTIALCFVFLSDILAQVPGAPTTPTDDGNTPDVPIQFLVYPLLLLGAYLGFKVLKKK